MSDLDQIITVQISRNTTTPSQVGFGTPFLLTADPELNPEAGQEWGSTRVRSYNSLSGVEVDFATTTNTYAMAAAAFSQNPRPTLIKIGRRDTFVAQVVDFTPTTFADNTTVGVEIGGVTYELLNSGNASIADVIADWLAAHSAALTTAGITAADATTYITLTSITAGDIFTYGRNENATLEESTAGTVGTDLVADLQACQTEDDDWYLLLIDGASQTEITTVATTIEAQVKLFVARSFDTDIKTIPVATEEASPSTTAGNLKNSNVDRTALFYTETGDYLDCAWAGNVLPEPAGSVTWAYRELSAVGADSFNASESGILEGKNVNTNTTLAGVNITRYGTASGGEYLDVMRGADWLAARIQERIFAVLVNNDKLPYTDAGIQVIRGEILAQLEAGIARDFIAATPEPTCTVPLAVDVSQADKGNRVLNQVTFRATLAGAIHKTNIFGELDL